MFQGASYHYRSEDMSGVRIPKDELVLSIDDPILKDANKDENPSAEGQKRERTMKLLVDDLNPKRMKVWAIGRDSMNIRKPSCQRKLLLVLSVLTASLDPLFFYIPMINMKVNCLRSDKLIGVKAIVFRTLADVLYVVLWMHYHEGFFLYKRGNSRSFSDKSPQKSLMMARVIVFLSILPLPQAVTILILSIKGSPRAPHAVTLLKFTVLCQFFLRAVRIFPAFTEATRNSYSLLMSRVWVGAGFNLILFMISSHVVGAFWYLLAVGRTMDCFKSACLKTGCQIPSLYCNGHSDHLGNKAFLNHDCLKETTQGTPPFDFGIYLPALQTKIVGSTNFSLKISYCFWWGLRNLSSLGQNLSTSAHEWEICFSICISVLGLILFSLFIGNMQTYFQSKTQNELKKMGDKLKEKLERIICKQQRLSAWAPLQVVSAELQEQIKSCRGDKWVESQDINLKSILQSLPKKLSKKLKSELCNNALSKLDLFVGQQDERQIEALYDIARPATFLENSCILKPKDPIYKTILIVSGSMSVTNQDGSTTRLLCGDSVGEQLLTQAISDSSSSAVPISTMTVVTLTKVEAFIIKINDLRSVSRYSRVLSAARKFRLLRPRSKTTLLPLPGRGVRSRSTKL
ncbi:hypothetical protein MLD38_002938 [Melastoma candidum]|uniref:Uncharacterized protein n=1 Tax=Melastoma candidum TaxID=119954 RepID=A0ACB9S2X3_9MYRT|nr:hypothetical protein MLD38_002938 [Melastoma candidum]